MWLMYFHYVPLSSLPEIGAVSATSLIVGKNKVWVQFERPEKKPGIIENSPQG